MSQTVECPLKERRKDPIRRSVYRPAYIRIGDALHYVTMRNISPKGACFRGWSNANLDQEIYYYIGDSEPVLAKVKWSDGQTFGVEKLVRRIDDHLSGAIKANRLVRLPIMATIQLYHLGFKFGGFLRDLSQTGACIDSNVLFSPGDQLTLQIGRISIECATVKWVENSRAGIRFAQVLNQKTISTALEQGHSCETYKV